MQEQQGSGRPGSIKSEWAGSTFNTTVKTTERLTGLAETKQVLFLLTEYIFQNIEQIMVAIVDFLLPRMDS